MHLSLGSTDTMLEQYRSAVGIVSTMSPRGSVANDIMNMHLPAGAYCVRETPCLATSHGNHWHTSAPKPILCSILAWAYISRFPRDIHWPHATLLRPSPPRQRPLLVRVPIRLLPRRLPRSTMLRVWSARPTGFLLSSSICYALGTGVT